MKLENKTKKELAESLKKANEEIALLRITERDQTAWKPGKSEEQARLLVDGIPDYAIIMLDPKGNIISWNNGAERLKGYGEEEVIGRHLSLFYTKSDADKGVPAKNLELAAQNGRFEDRGWRVRKDGSRFQADVIITALKNRKGQITGFSKITRDITAQTKAQEALVESEKKYRSLFAAMNEGVVLHELVYDSAGKPIDYRILEVNPAFEKIVGIEKEQATGKLATELYGTSPAPYLDIYSHAAETGEPTNFETSFDPMQKSFAISVFSPAKNQFATVFEDVTERKKTEEALQASEERWRTRLDFLIEGCQIIDFDWRYIYINDAAAQQGQRKKEELLGKTMMEAYPGIENTELFADLKSARNQRVAHHRENEFFFPDGSKGWFELSIQPVPEGVFILSMDITERKKSEESLRTQRQRLVKQSKVTSDFLNILEITSTSLNFSEAMAKVLPLICSLTDSDYCMICLIDERTKTLRPAFQRGLGKAHIGYFESLELDPGDLQPLLMLKVGVFPEIQSSVLPGNLKELFAAIGSSSALIMPIKYHNQPTAVILSAYSASAQFDSDKRETMLRLQMHLEAFYLAHKHSVSLLSDTIRLNQQLQTLSAMRDIDTAILSSSTEMQVIYRTVKLFGQAIPADIIELVKMDERSPELRLDAIQAEEKISIDLVQIFEPQEIRSWESLVFGIPSYYADLTTEPDLALYEKRFADRNIRSLLMLPLLSRGRIMGFIALGNRKTAIYTEEQLQAAQALGNQVAVALSNIGLINELQDLLLGTVNSLAAALDAKSPWTQGHSRRVSQTSIMTGKALRLDDSELFDLELASLFHDIGKIGTFEKILNKPESLNQEETALIRKHPTKTFEILSVIPRLKEIGRIAMHHHERWDGSGYPDGLRGVDIPLLSRIIAIADTFDAMTSDRPYRKALSAEEALEEISLNAGIQFDPDIGSIFVDLMRKELKKVKGKNGHLGGKKHYRGPSYRHAA